MLDAQFALGAILSKRNLESLSWNELMVDKRQKGIEGTLKC